MSIHVLRQLRRKAKELRKAQDDYEPKPQFMQPLADGGYLTLHPTKGWIRVSGARMRAQLRMGSLLDHFIPARMKLPSRNGFPAYRKSIWPAAKVAARRAA